MLQQTSTAPAGVDYGEFKEGLPLNLEEQASESNHKDILGLESLLIGHLMMNITGVYMSRNLSKDVNFHGAITIVHILTVRQIWRNCSMYSHIEPNGTPELSPLGTNDDIVEGAVPQLNSTNDEVDDDDPFSKRK
ncbi:hypothetical protein RHSIM_Rhsim09G0071400 [Rhododendron simsii]|uniref:Uncharacterized protein n=1 Tax=Rhododendron simsii TaxID=118357 RepID=A0A834LE82_RHOSS|nr:hypothetical protein RHSIM_Rhsim09G0071400 [Rhododendron simsii]